MEITVDGIAFMFTQNGDAWSATAIVEHISFFAADIGFAPLKTPAARQVEALLKMPAMLTRGDTHLILEFYIEVLDQNVVVQLDREQLTENEQRLRAAVLEQQKIVSDLEERIRVMVRMYKLLTREEPQPSTEKGEQFYTIIPSPHEDTSTLFQNHTFAIYKDGPILPEPMDDHLVIFAFSGIEGAINFKDQPLCSRIKDYLFGRLAVYDIKFPMSRGRINAEMQKDWFTSCMNMFFTEFTQASIPRHHTINMIKDMACIVHFREKEKLARKESRDSSGSGRSAKRPRQ